MIAQPTPASVRSVKPESGGPGGVATKPRVTWAPATLALVLCLGFWLRLAPWGQNRFLEDEALYAYWGLQIATGADKMLDLEPVDKPPLHPYLLALSFTLLGKTESAARLVSLLASMADIALVFALGTRLFADSWVGLVAAALLALSPFDILFASTAFTDPLMTTWVLAALLAVAHGRLGSAGLLCGLAAATKQQGLLHLPLVLATGLLPAGSRRPRASAWLRFALAFAAIAAAALAWDQFRLQRPGFLEQSILSYGGLSLARAGELGRRGADWLRLLASFWVSPWFNALLCFSLTAWAIGQRRITAMPRTRAIDMALLLFVTGYLLLHWLIDLRVWDRYLLSLVPLAALLGSRSLCAVSLALYRMPWKVPRPAAPIVLGVATAAFLAGPNLQAARSGLPLGGDHGAYDGIDRLATFMRAEASPGSVLYHHWLGYHYRFYLYDTALRLHWYPDPEDLVGDATVYRRLPRYIAFPSWRDSTIIEKRLKAAGIALTPVLETFRRDGTVSFRLYQMAGP